MPRQNNRVSSGSAWYSPAERSFVHVLSELKAAPFVQRENMVCTVSFKPADGSASRVTYFGKTLRTYISGPGKGDETWLTPADAAPGSPAPIDPS